MSRKMERIVRVLSAMTIGRSPFFDVKRLRATSRAIAAGLGGAGRRYGSEPTTSKMGGQQMRCSPWRARPTTIRRLANHAEEEGSGVSRQEGVGVELAGVSHLLISGDALIALRQRARERPGSGCTYQICIDDSATPNASRSSPVRLASYASAAAASSAVRASGGL